MTASEPSVADIYRMLQEMKTQNETQNGEGYKLDSDAITVEAWLAQSNNPKTQSRFKQRRRLIGNWATANGRTIGQEKVGIHFTFTTDSLLREVEAVLNEIRANRLTVYASSTKFWTWMIQEGFSSQTRTQFRSILPDFFLKVLGTRNFNRDKFQSIVPNEKVYTEVTKKIPTFEEAVSMAQKASLQYRALIGCFVGTGWRVGELLGRKWSDLEIRKAGYARLHIRAQDTKSRYERYAFLTPEAVTWLKNHEASLTPERQKTWLFPGFYVEKDGAPKTHLGQGVAEQERERATSSPHIYEEKHSQSIERVR